MSHYRSLKHEQEAELRELSDHYEILYRRLHCLFDGDYSWPDVTRSQTSEGPDLYLHVIARHKFTTIIHLTHYFEDQGDVQANPATVFRIYHDLHNAEAVSSYPNNSIERLTRPWTSMRKQVTKRLELNRFARKWLSYLLQHGHSRESFVEVSNAQIPQSVESQVSDAEKNLDRVIQTA